MERALRLAGLVTRLFREAGWKLSEARGVAMKMLAACAGGLTPVDRKEVNRLARLPSFNFAKELDALKKEVIRELNREA